MHLQMQAGELDLAPQASVRGVLDYMVRVFQTKRLGVAAFTAATELQNGFDAWIWI